MRTPLSRAIAVLALVSIATVAVGQQNQPAGGQFSNQPGRQAGQIGNQAGQAGQAGGQFGGQAGFQQPGFGHQEGQWNPDRMIGRWLTASNEGEIRLAKFGQQRAQNDDVKKFAQQMVQDHTNFVNQLQPFAGEMAGAQQQQGQPAGQQQGQQAQQQGQPGQQPLAQQPGQAGGQMAGMGVSPMKLGKEICEQKISNVEHWLDSKPQSEFDRAFLWQLLGGHQAMIAELQVMRKYASPQLQQVLDQGLQAAQQHLAHIEQLKSQVDKGSSTAQREATTR